DDRGFVRGDRVLIEYRRGVIPMDGFEVFEAESVGAVSAVPQTRFLHERPPRRSRLPPDPLPVAYRVTVDDSARRPIPRPINGNRLVSMLRRSSTHSFRQSLADEPFLDEAGDLIAVLSIMIIWELPLMPMSGRSMTSMLPPADLKAAA